jgi:hypothetical protein
VYVPCGDELKFFYDANGNFDFSIGARTDDSARRFLEADEAESAKGEFLASLIAASGGAVADVTDAASSLGEGVEDVTISSLRGAKGSKRIL